MQDRHSDVTTDSDGKVAELGFTGEGISGEIPESVFELRELEAIRTKCGVTLEENAPQGVVVEMASECPDSGGGCALGSEDFSASGLLLAALTVFAASLAARNRRFFGSPGRVP